MGYVRWSLWIHRFSFNSWGGSHFSSSKLAVLKPFGCDRLLLKKATRNAIANSASLNPCTLPSKRNPRKCKTAWLEEMVEEKQEMETWAVKKLVVGNSLGYMDDEIAGFWRSRILVQMGDIVFFSSLGIGIWLRMQSVCICVSLSFSM